MSEDLKIKDGNFISVDAAKAVQANKEKIRGLTAPKATLCLPDNFALESRIRFLEEKLAEYEKPGVLYSMSAEVYDKLIAERDHAMKYAEKLSDLVAETISRKCVGYPFEEDLEAKMFSAAEDFRREFPKGE